MAVIQTFFKMRIGWFYPLQGTEPSRAFKKLLILKTRQTCLSSLLSQKHVYVFHVQVTHAFSTSCPLVWTSLVWLESGSPPLLTPTCKSKKECAALFACLLVHDTHVYTGENTSICHDRSTEISCLQTTKNSSQPSSYTGIVEVLMVFPSGHSNISQSSLPGQLYKCWSCPVEALY